MPTRSLAELLDASWRLAWSALPRFAALQAVVYGPALAFTGSFAWWCGARLEHVLRDHHAVPVPQAAAAIVAFACGLYAIQVAVAALSSVVLSLAAARAHAGPRWSVGEVLRDGRRVLSRALALALFQLGLYAAGLALPGALIAALLASTPAAGHGSSAALLLGACGLLVLLLGALSVAYLLLRYGLAASALAIEALPVSQALSRSAQLMRGRYLQALALFASLTSIMLVLVLLLSLVVPAVSFEAQSLSALQPLLPSLIRSQILSQLTIGVALAISGIYSNVCWTLFFLAARSEQDQGAAIQSL